MMPPRTDTVPDRLADALDGARLVKVDEELATIAVWRGGVTINFYGLSTFRPQTCFALDDGKGRPEDVETVEEHIEELFEEKREQIFGSEY